VLEATIAASRAEVSGGLAALRRGPSGGPGHAGSDSSDPADLTGLPAPRRPKRVPAGTWRRMSRLARLAAAAAVPLLEAREDRATLPMVWGTSIGELGPTSRLLRRMAIEGPATASPLAFQNSVTNAPAGHLSIALGLKGPSQTVSAGGATGLTALLRGMLWLRRGAQAVLVVAGDDRTAMWDHAWALQPDPPPLGEAVAALLLTADGAGPRVTLQLGAHPAPGALSRRRAYPGEHLSGTLAGCRAIEDAIGLTPSAGLVAVVALTETGGTVIDRDGPRAITARVRP